MCVQGDFFIMRNVFGLRREVKLDNELSVVNPRFFFSEA